MGVRGEAVVSLGCNCRGEEESVGKGRFFPWGRGGDGGLGALSSIADVHGVWFSLGAGTGVEKLGEHGVCEEIKVGRPLPSYHLPSIFVSILRPLVGSDV